MLLGGQQATQQCPTVPLHPSFGTCLDICACALPCTLLLLLNTRQPTVLQSCLQLIAHLEVQLLCGPHGFIHGIQ